MSCFFGHKWGKWEIQAFIAPMVHYVHKTGQCIPGGELEAHQEKKCLRCGKIKQEKLDKIPVGYKIKKETDKPKLETLDYNFPIGSTSSSMPDKKKSDDKKKDTSKEKDIEKKWDI